MTEHVRAKVDQGVLTLTLARPEKKNALTTAMYKKLTAELTRAEEDPAVRVVLIESEGDTFTAGNDIMDFAAFATGQAPASEMGGHVFLAALARAQKPYVAAVQGKAVGIGTTMLLHCDLVFVAEDAVLTTPFVNLALVPEAASSMLLPARVGHARAFAMFALGEPVDSRKAVEIGLANAAVPASEVRARALTAARALAERPIGALIATKRLMRDADLIARVMEKEGEHFRVRLKSPEAAEAFRAFAERRAPDFSKVA
ncbi:MAG TPA: enoyl-CoA hydratase-related protein [Xanthobacteraceae bacterium]|nr:enoyl-CoA hydratase-related protein [Xanthobacteraceae bacterium]